MEVSYKDDVAKTKCQGKRQRVVALVHQSLGLASVVEVSSEPEREALKLETASGSVFSNYDLTKIL